LVGLGSVSSLGGIALGAGLLISGLWFALFFVLGTIVSAQGQILKANIDCAVNTAPFLTSQQKARVMGLV
jgi:hypothetical protein